MPARRPGALGNHLISEAGGTVRCFRAETVSETTVLALTVEYDDSVRGGLTGAGSAKHNTANPKKHLETQCMKDKKQMARWHVKVTGGLGIGMEAQRRNQSRGEGRGGRGARQRERRLRTMTAVAERPTGRGAEASSSTRLPAMGGGHLGRGPPAPVQPADDCSPTDILAMASRESRARPQPCRCQIPGPRGLWELVNVGC